MSDNIWPYLMQSDPPIYKSTTKYIYDPWSAMCCLTGICADPYIMICWACWFREILFVSEIIVTIIWGDKVVLGGGVDYRFLPFKVVESTRLRVSTLGMFLSQVIELKSYQTWNSLFRSSKKNSSNFYKMTNIL